MNCPHCHHPDQPRRNRTPLTLACITILAFALGAVVSIWLFNRAIPAAPLPLLSHQAAAAAPSTASPRAEPATAAAGVTGQPAAPAATLQAAEAGHPPGVGDKRAAPAERRALAGASASAGDKAAHTHSPVSSESAPVPAQTQTARRASAGQPAPAARAAGGRGCMLSTSKSKLTLRGKGSAAEIAISLGGPTGPAAVTATTGDWANIVVFPGARRGGVSTYRIVSVGQRPGTYGVTFSSPCGTKRIAVTVE